LWWAPSGKGRNTVVDFVLVGIENTPNFDNHT
jgi:hypothetical protein